MLIGYARVSSDDQNLNLQKDALTRAGCERILEDRQSGATSRNGNNRTLRPIERRAGPELALFNLLVQPPAMVQSIVGKELIGRDMLELAFRVRVEGAHPDVADAVTVHGVLLNPPKRRDRARQ